MQPRSVLTISPVADRMLPQCGAEWVDPAQAALWFAGKRLQAGKALGDYLGRNEKTRAVVKLTESGAPAPPREPVRGWPAKCRWFVTVAGGTPWAHPPSCQTTHTADPMAPSRRWTPRPSRR